MTPTLISFCDIENNLRYVNINNEFLIDCANIGISQEEEVFGPPKTYLLHSVLI